MISNIGENNKSISYNIFKFLCIGLIASVFFTNLIHFKQLGSKFQLTEIVFLLMIPFIPYKKLISYNLKYNRTFILIVLTYLLFDLTSSVLSHRSSAIMESFGRFYLLIIFTILSYHFSTYNKTMLLERLTQLLLFCSAIIILLAIYGYAEAFTKGWSRYIYTAYNYPYFGTIYRLIGPTIYPTMLISCVSFIVILLTGARPYTPYKKWTNAIIIFLFVCALLTFSKSIVLLVFALSIFLLKALGLLNKKMFAFITIIVTCVMIFFTHFIVLNRNSTQAESIKATVFTSNRFIFQTENYIVLEANYLAVKRAGVHMISEHPFFGIGTGNFNNALSFYKAKGLFPKKLPNYDPHCTYLGILVENGLFAEIILIAMLVYVFKIFIKRKDLLSDNFLLALFLIYLVFIIEGISTDILNFRHLWLFFALALFYLQKTDTWTQAKINN